MVQAWPGRSATLVVDAAHKVSDLPQRQIQQPAKGDELQALNMFLGKHSIVENLDGFSRACKSTRYEGTKRMITRRKE